MTDFPSALQVDLIPQAVWQSIERLEDKAFAAYLVGGSVRDLLLGRQPHDYDIATSARPADVQEVFQADKLIPTGLKFGSQSLVLPDLVLEITSYRTESSYSDRRRPDSVAFTDSIEADLARRDFTINALAYNLQKGLVDPFSGLKDLKARTIRAVGLAEHRFAEDPLRILRGLRFASVLDFDIENLTKSAILKHYPLLKTVASERINQELRKLLLGPGVKRVLLDFAPVFCQLIPELEPCLNFNQHSPYHAYDVYRHTVEVLAHTPLDLDLRLAALFHDISKPCHFSLDDQGEGHFYGHAKSSAEIAARRLGAMRFEKECIKQVALYIRYHDGPLPEDPRLLKKRLAKLGPDNLFKLIDLQRADCLGQAQWLQADRLEKLDRIQKLAREIMAEKPPLDLKDLAVDGHDALALGLEGGAIGQALKGLLTQVLDGQIKNQRPDLLAALARFAADYKN